MTSRMRQQLHNGASDGAQFGKSTDLLSFYGAAPIAQNPAIATGTDAASTQTAVNAIITFLQTIGLTA